MNTQKIVQILRDQLEKVVRGQTNNVYPSYGEIEADWSISETFINMLEWELCGLQKYTQETRIRILTKTIINVVTNKCRY